MESAFERIPGVIDVVSGYEGGTGKDPTYESYAQKGHIEVIQVTYDPSKVSYEELLNIFLESFKRDYLEMAEIVSAPPAPASSETRLSAR